MTNQLENKVALITGAASGIGRSTAHLFAEEGASLLLMDIDDKAGHEVLEEVKGKGARAFFVSGDTSNPEAHQRAVEEARTNLGGLHIAVNNAGIGGAQAPVGEYPIDSWEKVIAVNLNGVFYGMRYQIPQILKSGGGSIVNISSILGQVGFANSSAYVAAKHGVVGLTKNAALEYSAQGVRVNAVGPAFINTPLLSENLSEEMMAGLAQMHPMGRIGKPEEVAELILWLAGSKSSFVSGSYYAVDGGYLSQ